MRLSEAFSHMENGGYVRVTRVSPAGTDDMVMRMRCGNIEAISHHLLVRHHAEHCWSVWRKSVHVIAQSSLVVFDPSEVCVTRKSSFDDRLRAIEAFLGISE